MDFINDNTTKTLALCSIFIASIVLSIVTKNSYAVLIAVCLILTMLSFLKFGKNIVIAAIFIFVAGFYYSVYRAPVVLQDDISTILPLKHVEMIGTVSTEPKQKSEDRLTFVFNVNKVLLNNQWKDITGNINIFVYDKYAKFNVIQIGQKLKLKGDAYQPFQASNPTQFDYSEYLLYKNVTAQMFVKWNDYQVLSQSESYKYRVLYYLGLLKKHIQKNQEQTLTPQQAQLMGGIVLGERAIPMDPDIKQNFVNAGLAHILAASGINVALLAFAWIFITSRLGCSHPVQYAGGMLIVIFYALLTGLPPSVMRASIMLELLMLGKLIDKNANMLAIITFVAFLLLLYNPYMILDIGFQLSFLTTLGLIISIPVFQKYIKTIPQSIAMAVLIPFIAQVWATPIILYNFNNFAAYSVIANFFAMPLVAVITYGGFLSSVVSVIPLAGSSIAGAINILLAPVLSLLLYIADYISHLPHSTYHFTITSGAGVLFVYVMIAIILYAMWKECKLKHYLIIILSLLVIISASLLFKHNKNELHITFFDVGNADCILINTPDGKNILIDGGYRKSEDNNSAKWLLRSYFYKHNIYDLDAVILTHPENDHIGGIPELLEEMNVFHYFDGGFSATNESYQYLLRLIYQKAIPYTVLRIKDQLKPCNDMIITVLNPSEALSSKKKMNVHSLVLRLDYKYKSIIFAGDTEYQAMYTIDKNLLDADVIKVGHHGSKKSLNQDYLEILTPEIAIISSKKEKAEKVQIIEQLLKKNNIKTYITGKSGAIELITDGKEIQVKEFLNNHY